MAIKNLVITSATTGGVPAEVMARFEDPPLVAMCPVTQFSGYKGGPPGRAGYNQWLQEHRDGTGRVVPGIFERNGGKGHELGRVCAMGFSNGCILVDELLKFPDAPQLDTVLAVDGIQTTVQAPWIDFGRYVVKHGADALNAPVLAITHTVIVPPNSPSTTQNADIIWSEVGRVAPTNALSDKCGFDCLPAVVVGAMRLKTKPVTIRGFTWNGLDDGWYDRRIANNFYVFGWADKNPTTGKMRTRDPAGTADHIFQGQQVLPALIEQLVARRWNRCAQVAVSGFGAFGASCAIPRGYRYGHGNTALFTRSTYPAPAPLAATAQAAAERFFVPRGVGGSPFGAQDFVAGAIGLAGGFIVATALAERFLR